MVLRLLRLGLLGLALVYVAGLGVIYAKQRDFVFDREYSSALKAPGSLAIVGSTRVTIPTMDGEKLAGWYLPPREKNGDVFLFFHGKGGALERKKWRWARLIKHGDGILAFSYRGFPGSTGLPSEDGLYEDARAAYHWLAQKHKPSSIVLHGLSLGTGVAAKLATEVKAKALVLEAPYAALVDVAAGRHPYFPVSYLLWDQFRTENFIADIKMPLLIVHGDHDTAIPLEHARKLFQLAPQPKKLVVMKGSDHNTLVRDGMYPHIWAFLKGVHNLGISTQSAGRM